MTRRVRRPHCRVQVSPLHSHLIHAIDEVAQQGGLTPPGLTGHDVQFYRREDELVPVVVDFLADGLRAGQPLVIIATEAHRHAFAAELRRRGLDTDEFLSGREAVWLDAKGTLSSFMEGRLPDRELFMATVGSVFERLLKSRNYLIVRGYGEMVDLLARSGNIEGAIELEKLWNELAGTYGYSLLCGYLLDNFVHDGGLDELTRVCAQHSHALPVRA